MHPQQWQKYSQYLKSGFQLTLVGLIYHGLQSSWSKYCPVERRRQEHDADWQQFIPALNERHDRVRRICRYHSRDKEKLDVEVRWKDALLECSELRKGDCTVAEPSHDKSLKASFTVRSLD